jgi:hypothetical protein
VLRFYLLVLIGLFLMACSPSPPSPSPASPSSVDASDGTSPPSESLMRLDLTYGSFSADGSRVAASWLVAARNRAGTDESTAVGTWDLGSGDSAILSGATGPVALSPDGATLLAMMPTRPARGVTGRPDVAPGLLSFGEVEPTTMLPMPESADPTDLVLVTATFHPAGRDLVALTASGRLLRWELTRMSAPTRVDALPAEVSPQQWEAAAMSFDSAGTQLMIVALPIDGDPVLPRMLTATWQVDLAAGRFERLLVEEVDAVDGLPSGYPVTPLSLVSRTIGGELTTTAPSGETVTRTLQTPHIEPAFSSPDGMRRLVMDDGKSKILVQTVDGGEIELAPGQRPVKPLDHR